MTPGCLAGKSGTLQKKDLAKELVAFANTDGGTLVLGVLEDGERRAASCVPIRDCRDLADRLGASMVEAADPSLTSLDVIGIEMDGRSGAVVFRVPSSYLAPHRAKDDMECYFRQGDRSVPMSMRQVKELAVTRASSLQHVERALNERQALFVVPQRPGMKLLPGVGHVPEPFVGFRASAFPLEKIAIDDLMERPEFHLGKLPVPFVRNGQIIVGGISDDASWEPVLRGIRAFASSADGLCSSTRTIRRDGLVEVTAYRPERFLDQGLKGVPLPDPLWTFAQLLVSVDCVRALAGRPDLPFALDFEWRFPGGAALLVADTDEAQQRAYPALNSNNRVNDHEMPTRDGLTAFWRRLQIEFLGSFGLTKEYLADFDFATVIRTVLAKR